MVGLRNIDVSYAMLNGWGGRIELFQYHSPEREPYLSHKPVSDKGITHIAFQVEDIGGLHEKLVGDGVRFNSFPQVLREGVKAAYFHDPEGIILELIQYS